MMPYSYCKAEYKDKILLFNLYRTVMKEYILQIWGWDEEWQVNDFTSNYTPDNIIIVKKNNDIVGYCHFEKENNSYFIRMLVVLPEHQNNGIGKKLLFLLREKSSLYSKHIRLYVFKINKMAKLFYLSQGFHVVGESETSYIMESTKSG